MQIFVSSPGDVGEERELASLVIQRLQREFSGRLDISPFFWEHQPLRATASFQEEIDAILRPSEADIVILILWSRLGTRLRPELTRPDGSSYSSGTEYEFEDAVNGHKLRGLPDILVYRKTAKAFADLSLTDEEYLERREQKRLVDIFLERWFKGADGSFTSSFLEFSTAAEFEEKLEQHIRVLIQKRLPQLPAEVKMQPVPPQWQGESPFRGLEIFDFQHAPIFCGRTQAISDILHALRHQASNGSAFVMVMGMSGGGKSSLVRAGVLPRLTQPGVIEGIGLWRYSIFRPSDTGGNLLEGLAQALMQEEALPRLQTKSALDLAGHLGKSPETVIDLALQPELVHLAAEVMQKEKLSRHPEARLILVVDQMEEIFTLEKVTPSQRQEFIQALAALARSGWVWVLATMRNDFFARCQELPELQELKKGDGQYDLTPPTPAEISQMIRQPAAMAGLIFEEKGETPGRLDDVLRDAAIANPQALPLLEFALEELYLLGSRDKDHPQVLTFEAYEELGGLQGAIARRADAVFRNLNPEERETALDQVLGNLVSLELGEKESLTATRAPLGPLASTPATQALVKAFVAARLFVLDRTDDGNTVVGVAHEALLAHWDMAQEWVDRNREILQKKKQILVAANIWAENNSKKDMLLQGNQLDEAEDILLNRHYFLPDTATKYIKSSLETRRKNLAGWLTLLILLLIIPMNDFNKYNLDIELNMGKIIYHLLFTLWLYMPLLIIIMAKLRKKRAFFKYKYGIIYWFTYVLTFLIMVIYNYVKYSQDSNLYFWLFAFFIILLIITIRITFLSRDIAFITRLIQRKQFITVILGAAVLSLMLLWYWDVYHRIRIEYYTTFIRRWGFPQGIGRISPEQAKLRNVCIEFHRKGRQQFIIHEVRKINGSGYYFQGIGTDTIKDFDYREGCRFKFYRSYENRDVIFEEVFDGNGKKTYNSLFFDRIRNVAVYNKTTNLKSADSNAGSGIVLIGFSLAQTGPEAGLEKEIHFLNEKWFPTAARDGSFGLKQEVNETGLPIEITCLGINGEPITNNEGYAKVTIKYDNNGNAIEVACWGLDGRPSLSKYGYAKATMNYNLQGNNIEKLFYGIDGKLISRDGCARLTRKFDERGNVIEEAYFDADGQPILKDGYARVTRKFNERGSLIEEAYVGVDGQPVVHKQGYARVTAIYNSQGLIGDVAFWGLDGMPARTKIIVKEVFPGSQEEKAGIQPGDRIMRYNGMEVANTNTYSESVRVPGKEKRILEVLRQGNIMQFLLDPGPDQMYLENQGATEPKGDQ